MRAELNRALDFELGIHHLNLFTKMLYHFQCGFCYLKIQLIRNYLSEIVHIHRIIYYVKEIL